jgi:hypothetical protein
MYLNNLIRAQFSEVYAQVMVGHTVSIYVLRPNRSEIKGDSRQSYSELELSLLVGSSEISLDEVSSLRQKAETEVDADVESNSITDAAYGNGSGPGSMVEELSTESTADQPVGSSRFDDCDSSYAALYETEESLQYTREAVRVLFCLFCIISSSPGGGGS